MAPKHLYGKINLKILVGLCEFEVSFVVVDIPMIFNLLLGRPWIHLAGAILWSLHQKVKFISGNELVTVMAKDFPMPASTMVPFIDAQQVDLFSK